MTIVKPDPMQPDTPPNRGCTAKNRRGGPCGGPAIRGLDKCRMHAGTDLATARARGLANLASLVPTAIDVLDNSMQQGEPAARLAAARIVVDTALNPRMGDVEAKLKEQHVQMLVDAFTAALGPLGLRAEEQEGVWDRFAAEIRRYEEATDDE